MTSTAFDFTYVHMWIIQLPQRGRLATPSRMPPYLYQTLGGL